MKPMNGTAYVILGMLSLGARTGYDVKRIVDQSTRFFWAASYGQIYPELRRLENAGLVEGRSSPTGGRKRTEYELTEHGRAALVGWLEAPAQMPEGGRDENLLKLFFADALPREQALELLRQRRVGHEEFLTLLQEIEARPGEDPPFVELVLRYGIAYAEFNVAWCEEQEARLREAARDAA